MQTYNGKSVFGGIAVGKIRLWQKNSPLVKRIHVDDTKSEYERFETAKQKTSIELKSLYEKACNEVGKDNASIFEIHQMMLDDEDFNDSVKNYIENQHTNAEYAVAATGENFAKMFAVMDDSYMKARAADVKDISDRLLSALNGNVHDEMIFDDPVILAADDLTPSETVQLDKTKVLAFVTAKGSANSHTAILARTMNIPAIIGVELTKACDGKFAVADGFSGTVYIDPEKDVLQRAENTIKKENEQKKLYQTLKGKENITLDGKQIRLYANIGNIRDLAFVLQNDADGIGLFRSEFIYLERNTFPTENEQFAIYKTVAETMAGKKVIIRTLDIGADKQLNYFDLGNEENPAMGLRAIRLCLKRPDIFKTQLRALLRASVFGDLAVMYPMIISMDEVKKIKSIVAECANELENEKIPYKIPEQGIMIETPAAVMISDMLAKEFSFFSIGTNDLLQYTMAIDRQNASLDEFFDPKSEAVMRMIETVINNGHKSGIWVGICGELGADLTMTEKLLKMGIDELSVSPPAVLPLRKVIRESTIR